VPPVVAFVAAALTQIGIGAATAAAIATVVVNVAISVAVTAIGSLLRPRQSNLSQRGDTLTFRAPTEARRIIYGETRVGGPILFLASSNEGSIENVYLHMVIALAGHEVQEIGDIYFGEEIVPLDGSGNATGFYSGHVRVKKWLGSSDQTADVDLMAAFPSVVTAAHRFRGIAAIYLRLRADSEGKWPQGIPNISAKVKGRRVYDPRDVGHVINEPTTWTWTDNAALCALDYLRGVPMRLMTTDLKRIYGLGESVTDDDIDLTTISAEASVCDELVEKPGGSTEKRYAVNGVIDSDITPNDALASLRGAIAGDIFFAAGQWQIQAGYWRPPTTTFDENDLAGPISTQVRRSRRDIFNGVKGVYVSPLNSYQPADFPSVQDASAIAADNGDEIWLDVEYPLTNAPSACQRLAWIAIESNRQQIVTTRRFNLKALAVRAGDVIGITDTRRGWTDKAFKVIKYDFVFDAGAVMIEMVLAETASGIWNDDVTRLVSVDTAPDTSLADPRVVSPPGGPGLGEINYVTRVGAGVKTRVTVSWAASNTPFEVRYLLEYRASGETAWTILPQTTATLHVFDDFAAGRWDFRVRALNVFGGVSSYAESLGLSVVGLSAAPAALTTLQVQAQGNQAVLTWTQSTDLDVSEGGKIEFRHSPNTSGVTWDTSTTIRESVPGSEVSAVVPLKAGTYVVRPMDSSGNPGPIASVVSKQASQHGFTALSGSPITESSAFSGTKSGCAVSGGRLSLSGAGLFDAIPDFDAVADLDSYGGLATEGTYTFASAFNFGAVTRARLTSVIDVAIVSTGDTIDSRTANIDEWDDFDGSVPGAGNAWVEFRQTDDNPSGSPTWTDWMRLDVAEVEAWGVQLRAQLRVNDPAYNVEIITLQVKAEAIT
jgi:hypothetical protein